MAEMGMSTLALDVTNKESIKTCHEEVAQITGGKLDILVNNAYVPSFLTARIPFVYFPPFLLLCSPMPIHQPY